MEQTIYYYKITFIAGNGQEITTDIQVTNGTREDADINAQVVARKIARVYRVKDISTIKVIAQP